ncbi:uncharacterized protein LOC134451116 [Engraulis encrasicolus]|uniref:uncharacterized protein LOC134451116 n=1 Tax=Engraulis encrasicolus TaxID=184585 RepID=UPI002FCEEEAB
MRFLLLLPFLCLFLQGCSAGQDLKGKAFTFPAETAHSYVKLQPSKTESWLEVSKGIQAISVCLRYFSDLPQKGKEQTFFSLATFTMDNAFLLGTLGRKRHQVYVGGGALDFWDLPDELNDWNSFCATWDSKTGVTQVWLNGIPSSRKTRFQGGTLAGPPIVVLGQDQDSYGGGFHQNDAMVGQLTDVHMWSRVISQCDIWNFSKNRKFTPGDVIDWQDLVFTTHGDVVLEQQIETTSQIGNCSIDYKQGSTLGETVAFLFGEETSISYIKVVPQMKGNSIKAATVCLRYFTDLPGKDREQTFFSLATPAHNNGFLVCKEGRSRHQLYVAGERADFWGLPDDLNTWVSFCATWDSATGIAQVWVNGRPSSRKTLFKGGTLEGTPFVVLGQDQDAYGGGFHVNDAMVGQLSGLHMWDHVISACKLQQYALNQLDDVADGGNLINWGGKVLDISLHGNALDDDDRIRNKVELEECSLE